MAKLDYNEFQARTTPRAYLITFRTYGTWLHGDDRGSVDRRYHNRAGSPKISPNRGLSQYQSDLLKHEPVVLDHAQRQSVAITIEEVCQLRQYQLLAVNVRSNHVHVEVDVNIKPELLMRTFKAYATRKLRQTGLLGDDVEPWSRHGSTIYLWDDEEIAHAVDYVMHGQDGDRFERVTR